MRVANDEARRAATSRLLHALIAARGEAAMPLRSCFALSRRGVLLSQETVRIDSHDD